MAISIEIRCRAVAAYKNGLGCYETVAGAFQVGSASLKRWVSRDRRTGSIESLPHGGGVVPKIDDEGASFVRETLIEHPDIGLEELLDMYNEKFDANVSVSTIGRPVQQDAPAVQIARANFADDLGDLIAEGRRLVFVDESGCELGMNRSYARAIGGQRANATALLRYGPRINLIGAIGVTGIRGLMAVEGSVDAEVMEQFARDVLAPNVRSDDVVIWDNFKPHEMEAVVGHIEARGAEVLPLPPYSPDLNPIEKLWSKMKATIRRLAPGDLVSFYQALKASVLEISEHDTRAWFRHCIGAAHFE